MLKIRTAHLICYSWDSTLVYFLSSLLPAHPLIFPSRAKSLSSRHPRKPSTTILIKHLAVERAIFVFRNMTNPMEPHSLLPANQISELIWFIRGRIARGEVSQLPRTRVCSKCSYYVLLDVFWIPNIWKHKCSISSVIVKYPVSGIDFITVNWVMETL